MTDRISVYTERALVVVCMAKLAEQLGIRVYRKKKNTKTDEWPVLYIELPAGQVSWHFSDEDAHLIKDFKVKNKHEWDGKFNGRDKKIMTNPMRRYKK